MADLSTVLPVTHLSDAVGGIVFDTTVYPGTTGLDSRSQNWATGRHAWTLTFTGYVSELASIIALFSEAKGKRYSFLFTPPGYSQGDFRFDTDELKVAYQASSVTNDYIGVITLPVVQVL